MSIKRNTKLLGCRQPEPEQICGQLTGLGQVQGTLEGLGHLSGNLSFMVETDPTVPDWAKQPNPPAAILADSIENWDSQIDLIAADKTIYAYYDGEDSDDFLIGIKFGDGIHRLIDLPLFYLKYYPGTGIIIERDTIRLDKLILDCGTSTTVLHDVLE